MKWSILLIVLFEELLASSETICCLFNFIFPSYLRWPRFLCLVIRRKRQFFDQHKKAPLNFKIAPQHKHTFVYDVGSNTLDWHVSRLSCCRSRGEKCSRDCVVGANRENRERWNIQFNSIVLWSSYRKDRKTWSSQQIKL